MIVRFVLAGSRLLNVSLWTFIPRCLVFQVDALVEMQSRRLSKSKWIGKVAVLGQKSINAMRVA